MNKRGFTLVELLAVIIILSLLALLTSTAVTNLVKDSRDDLSSTQMELIKSAAQTWGADNLTGLPEAGKCSYLTLANLKDYGLIDSNIKDPNTDEQISDELKIKISTEINDKSGKLITTYEVNPESLEGCYKQVYNNGDVVYFNVVNGEGCTEKDYREDNSKTGYNGYINKDAENVESEKLSTQTSCLKFYAFLDNGEKTLNLLLDHNTIVMGAGIDEISKLKTDTNQWQGTITPLNYKYKGTSGSYTIDYSGYNARLITAQEIAQITGADTILNWKEESSSNWYYLDSLLQTASDTCQSGNIMGCKYGWLYDRASTNCTTYGCLTNSDSLGKGYWTSSINAAYASGAWAVTSYGSMTSNDLMDFSGSYGFRPVIEVLKSNL